MNQGYISFFNNFLSCGQCGLHVINKYRCAFYLSTERTIPGYSFPAGGGSAYGGKYFFSPAVVDDQMQRLNTKNVSVVYLQNVILSIAIRRKSVRQIKFSCKRTIRWLNSYCYAGRSCTSVGICNDNTIDGGCNRICNRIGTLNTA